MPSSHIDSYYAAQADDSVAFPPLDTHRDADVAIVGGGFTGLSAALHLAERGVRVVLLEAHRVGWGATGRNGGQLHSGQRRDQDWLEARLGRSRARALWLLAEEAKALVHGLRDRHRIDCDWRPGLIEAAHRARLVAGERQYVERLAADYGYDQAEWVERDRLAAMIGTGAYHGGRLDHGAGHLDPLKFAQGLARAATGAGALIFEDSAATSLARRNGRHRIGTEVASVSADIVILAGNGHLDGIDAETEARAMPIANYMLATAPIGAGRPGGLIPGGEAVSDSRFVVHYWRPTPDGRLIFGGGETYSRNPPAAIAAFVQRHLRAVYPQLEGTAIDYAWGGTLAVTMTRLPFVRRVRPGVYAASGYSGQGVALAPYAGKLIADAIGGDTARFDRFAALPVPRFPGGRWLRRPALVAGMSWYALRDRI